MNRNPSLSRRSFMSQTGSLAGLAALGGVPNVFSIPSGTPKARADAMILIWLPGGVTQSETWDPKPHTPYRQGMRGNEILSTCGSIATPVDGLRIGEGLDHVAQQMVDATVIRSLGHATKFGAVHLKAQHYMMTGYIPPAGVRPPALGAMVSRVLGRRDPAVPAYVYIGRDTSSTNNEDLFVQEFIGSGFYGVDHEPFMIPDPETGIQSLERSSRLHPDQYEARLALMRQLADQAPPEIRAASASQRFRRHLEQARDMMDSPVREALDWKQESAATLEAYSPAISRSELLQPDYFHGRRFSRGLLLARRLVERGARFVQVEYPYGAFKGFDMHDHAARRMREMKQQIDRPIGSLIQDLRDRGLLERTTVLIASEFGRTVADRPDAGREPDGFREDHDGRDLVVESERMYGLHGHFSSAFSVVAFGGGFRRGFIYGKTAERHPMLPVENPTRVEDLHATLLWNLGIRPDIHYVTEGRPFYLTNNGEGSPLLDCLA